MATYVHGDRELSITTPLGKDVLLITGIKGVEAISQLFSFQIELLAELTAKIQFDKVIGQKATVEMRMPNGEKRYFDGIIRRFSQGHRDENFVRYRAELVPKIWLLTKHARCRIFQQTSIPDILNKVFTGFDVSYKFSTTYYARDYCVQYRESDFDFASRLMEEEGIYYFFDHTQNNHQLVVTDDPTQHPAVNGQTSVTYEEVTGGMRENLRITSWEKTQELRSGEYTLWDHCFELPGKNLEAKEKTIGSVNVGTVTHKLNVGGNDKLEIYDYPGRYAQRFDGVGHSGADQHQNLQDIFRDKDRTVRVRMEQEEVRSIEITGASNCGHFVPGHRFSLERHFDANGAYLLTRVEHTAHTEGTYRSDEPVPFVYKNLFTCIPLALPYRPQRVTTLPSIDSHQTATVVGPKGEELFCDKYGRIKVQFHWDREGKNDGDSSCWVRVAQPWAGKGWGAFFWPRIGHEVVIVFEDGDPDQPLIIGSVYNAENMPPYELPKANMFCGFKSASIRGQAGKNFNGIVFVDKKGQEHLSIHSERHLVFNAEFDKSYEAGRHSGERVPGGRTITVGRLPGGGGSGGGGPDDNLWPKGGGGVEPTAILGFNSTVVYGGNFQVAVPLNVQIALGSNLQICVNPLSFASIFTEGPPPPLAETTAQVLGGGFGGNMQLTLGTNANFTLGQAYEINVGPKKIGIDVGEKTAVQPGAKIVGTIIAAVIIVFLIAYGFIHDDDGRAFALMLFQIALQMLLMALMQTQTMYEEADETECKCIKEVHAAKTEYLDKKYPTLNAIAESGSIIALFMTPFLLEAIGEAKLSEVKSDSSSSNQPSDSGGQGGQGQGGQGGQGGGGGQGGQGSGGGGQGGQGGQGGKGGQGGQGGQGGHKH